MLRADGGPNRPNVTRIIRGAREVASGAMTYRRMAPHSRPALVNGVAGLVVAPEGRLFSVAAFTVRSGKIVEIDILSDPKRLATLDITMLDD